MSKDKNTAASAVNTAPTGAVTPPSQYFVFGKTNYMIMVAGIVLIGLGYFLMRGGGTDPAHPEIFDAAEKYSAMRITYAPIIIVVGLFVEVFAIMYKQKD